MPAYIDGCRSSSCYLLGCAAEPRTLQLSAKLSRYRFWTMHILKRLFARVDGPLLHGMLAGCAIMVISALGLFYLWHSAREAQLDAVRTELVQFGPRAATLVDGDRHRLLKSQAQAGQPGSLGPLGAARQVSQSHLRHHLRLHRHPR